MREIRLRQGKRWKTSLFMGTCLVIEASVHDRRIVYGKVWRCAKTEGMRVRAEASGNERTLR